MPFCPTIRPLSSCDGLESPLVCLIRCFPLPLGLTTQSVPPFR